MQDSLGGNAKTLMFVNISPADYNQDETSTALTYATRVKQITNEASKHQVYYATGYRPRMACIVVSQSELLNSLSVLELWESSTRLKFEEVLEVVRIIGD